MIDASRPRTRAGRARAVYAALALGTMIVGLAVHRDRALFSAVARDVLGDALWAAMIAWGIGLVQPRATRIVRSAVALTVCVVVEVSQLYHTPALDTLRETTFGRLVLGSGFDPRDLAAYAGGVLCVALIDAALIARRAQ
jgi:hypothetical protein